LPGRGANSRARQTGAGEHRHGDGLAAGGAATAAAVAGEWGDGPGQAAASHLQLLALRKTPSPLTRRPPPDDVFGGDSRVLLGLIAGGRSLCTLPPPLTQSPQIGFSLSYIRAIAAGQ